jgi:hypothetical protein
MNEIQLFDELANGLQAMNRRNGSRKNADDLRAAVVALRGSQFIFEQKNPGHYAILKNMQSSLKDMFALMGSKMFVDESEGYIALVPQEDMSRISLTIDETLLLLSLRLVYEERIEDKIIENDGTVLIRETEVLETFEKKTGRTLPRQAVLKSAFEFFERRSILTISQDDNGERHFFVRSTIRLIVGPSYVRRIQEFAEMAMARKKPETHPVDVLSGVTEELSVAEHNSDASPDAGSDENTISGDDA